MWMLVLLALSAAPAAHAQTEGPQNQSPCLLAWENRAPRNRPIVKVSKNLRYRTILSLDGGDVRATIHTAVLCELELIVKRNLINLGKVSFADIDDFDILLSDYFDLIAGTSAGTYISTYLGTDGGDHAAMRNVGIDTAVPGSAYGAFQFMQGFGPMVADAFTTVPGDSTEYEVVGPWVYNYFDNYFSSLYGNMSTVYGHDPSKASMLWTWSRASNGGGATSMALYKDNEAAKGGVTHYNLDGTITSEDDNDFYLWQAIRGATSWPPRVPTYIATTTPMSPVRSTFPIIDGAITSMDPTSAALPWIQMHTNTVLKRTAILSIGTGAVMDLSTDSDFLAFNQDNSRAWVSTLATCYRSTGTFKSMMGQLSDYQYVRIDQVIYTGPEGDDCGGVWEGANCTRVRDAIALSQPEFLPTYTQIGAMWAQLYYRDMNQFVSKFLLDGIDHD